MLEEVRCDLSSQADFVTSSCAVVSLAGYDGAGTRGRLVIPGEPSELLVSVARHQNLQQRWMSGPAGCPDTSPTAEPHVQQEHRHLVMLAPPQEEQRIGPDLAAA